MTKNLRLKNRDDIRGIYRSGQVTAELLAELSRRAEPGVTTGELNRFAEEFIAAHGAQPAFKGYNGFPASICASVNQEIVHGIPREDRILEQGDVLKLDTGVVLDGYVSDAARTVIVGGGEVPAEVLRLLEATQMALDDGISRMRTGNLLNRVSSAISERIRSAGFKVIRDLTGHGVGFSLHEPPVVHNYPVPEGGVFRLVNGLVLALEPMASLSCEEILLGEDGWTYATVDGSTVAHFEDTVAIVHGHPVVLTRRDDGAEALKRI
ncbi:MAG: type I methionyl aminopeptidase [Planctomycetales bacterium 4484_113]|nr:MAG: type I methionyl aminopeptidase [Planctomycetales bacterium 4484_113]